MLTYKAIYKYLDDAIHAEVLDFPGAISCGKDLDEARRMLASALVDMAETYMMRGKPLPIPNPNATEPDSDIEERFICYYRPLPMLSGSSLSRTMKLRDLLSTLA